MFTSEMGNENHELPDVICECGNTGFTLTYGKYCVDAKCTKCGKNDTVYSG